MKVKIFALIFSLGITLGFSQTVPLNPDQNVCKIPDSYNLKPIASIKPKGKLLDKAKAAIITGILTASSGEVTALAF